MSYTEEQVDSILQQLALRWSGQGMVYPNLKRMPHSERPSNTAISAGILWPLKGQLSYACRDPDSSNKNDWAFKNINHDHYFYFNTDEWMMRNSSKRFCLCKIEWQPDITLITINDNATKYYFEKTSLPSSLHQQFSLAPAFDNNPPLFQLHIHSLIGLCLGHALHTPQQHFNKSYRTFLACCEHVREHLDQDINRSTVAQMLDIHPGHVSRLFKQYHDGGYDSWLRQERVYRAKQLLKDPGLSIEDIAGLCGISNTSWFIRCFKEETGTTPGIYRQTR